MSQTISSVIVLILAQVLPLIGVHTSSEALDTTLQTILSVGAGLLIWYRRIQVGDVGLLGNRK